MGRLIDAAREASSLLANRGEITLSPPIYPPPEETLLLEPVLDFVRTKQQRENKA